MRRVLFNEPCPGSREFDYIARDLMIIEDTAQAANAFWRDRPPASIGQFSTLSFRETKNVISGEGGALIANDSTLVDRADVLWNRTLTVARRD
jgi:dTDP-4-amino-4,6-dideoxygalactose transaminase